MKIRTPLIAIALVVCACVAYGAGTEAYSRGKAIYEQYCTVCHGRDGSSETPLGSILEPQPRNLADPVAMARVDDEHIYRAIRDGKPGTSMPPWGRLLNEQQVRDVVGYVKSLKRPRPAGMSQDDFDIAIGGQIYQHYCTICHGSMGDAQTQIGHVLSIKPRNFSDMQKMRLISDEEMARAIAFGMPGTAMVGWRSLLSPSDIRHVVMYIRHQLIPNR